MKKIYFDNVLNAELIDNNKDKNKTLKIFQCSLQQSVVYIKIVYGKCRGQGQGQDRADVHIVLMTLFLLKFSKYCLR